MDPTPPSQRAPLNESARASRRNWLCTLGGLGASTVLGGHLTAQAQATTASKAHIVVVGSGLGGIAVAERLGGRRSDG